MNGRCAALRFDASNMPPRPLHLVQLLFSQFPRRLSVGFVTAAVCLAAAAGAPTAEAAPPVAAASAPTGVELSIPLSGIRADFRIANPDLPSSPASRNLGGDRGWTDGYRITSRLIARALDPKALDAALLAAKVPAAKPIPAFTPEPGGPTGPLAEFYWIDTPSIRDAVALADALAAAPGIAEAYVDVESPKALRSNLPTDPNLGSQWHLINTTNPAADVNADAAWKAGYTGAGVTIGVLEGGWDINHEDLAANYHAQASQPAFGQSDHGTAVAGLAAAAGNNNRGGVGVAYGARLSRLYYGSTTDIANAFAFRNDLNAIKTNSWGPFDNGYISTISSAELAAFETAVTTGRDGKGVVLIWASGNGGAAPTNDRVDYDPYGSNRFAMAVGAIDFFDRPSIYTEGGSALMFVTTSDYDLFTTSDVGMYTTWGFNTYTSQFGGTSSSAPVAAGAAALVLQANPNLTWRDVQHVMIRAARRVNPADPSWIFNGAGAGNVRAWSPIFGFGAIDAGAAAVLASTWTNRPPQSTFTSPVTAPPVSAIPDNSPAGVASSITVAGQGPLIVERVQVVLNAPHARIGQLRITLTSPSGTAVTIAGLRADDTPGGYANYTFSPAAFWDERAAGTWTLKLADEVAAPAATGSFTNWQLKIFGYTATCPCDWNLSGGTPTLQDLFDFFASYFAGKGDFNGDAAVTVQDIFEYLACYFLGCA
jgi:subtilisin-like proprotein convertase family protein